MFKNFEQPLFKPDPEDPGLLQLAFEGQAVLPQFQREWIWQPNRVVSLLHSIARGWPAGSLLLMDGTREFPSRVLEGVTKKPRKDAKYSILDGQQRLSALLQAYYDLHNSHVFFVRIRDMVQKGEFSEDDFDSLTRSKWTNKNHNYDKLSNAASAGVIMISDLLDDNRFEGWLGFLPEGDDRTEYREFRSLRLQNLKTYSFHASVIDKGASPEVLTAVFSTINQQGVALNTFDLMVAVSWQVAKGSKKGYHLRDEWEKAAEHHNGPPKYPRVANFNVEPILALRLVKLLKGLEGSVSDAEILKKLKGKDVRSMFGDSITSIDACLKFLHDNCGVIPETLPHETLLLPISFVIDRHPQATETTTGRDKLLEWFWKTSFAQRYGRGGTNTRVVKDADELESWIEDDEAKPAWLVNFWSTFERSSFVETETGNGMLLRAMLCLQNHAGAKDWKRDQKIFQLGRQPRDGSVDATSVLQRHHVFPQDVKLPEGQGKLQTGELFENDHDIIVNRALIRSNTNSEIQATPPGAVEERGCKWEFIESHLIEKDSLGSWSAFVNARVVALEVELEKQIPR